MTAPLHQLNSCYSVQSRTNQVMFNAQIETFTEQKMKLFGTNSTEVHAHAKLNTSLQKRSLPGKQNKSSAANYCSIGDQAYQDQDFTGAIDHYLHSLRLILPRELCDKFELDQMQCKKNCVAADTLLKVSMAYRKVDNKREAQSSLKSAKALIEPVTVFDMDQENTSDVKDYVVKYSAVTLLAKVLETEGDLLYERHDLTMAEETYHKALFHKREAVDIIRRHKTVSKVFSQQIEIDLELSLLLSKIGTVLHKRGNFNESALAYSEALAIRQGEPQIEDADKEIFYLKNALFQVYKETGDYAAAMKYLDLLTETYANKKTKGPIFKLTLEKSKICILTKKFALAMNAATESLELADSQGSDHNERMLSRAVAMEQIGKVLEAQCCLDMAILWYKRAHAARSSILPENHDTVLRSTKQIANIYLKQGKLEEAKTLFKEIRDKLVTTKGIESKSVADLLDDLGMVYSKQKDFSTAMKCHKKALDIRRKCHPLLLAKDGVKTLDRVACLLLKQGKRFAAMKYFSEALDVLRKNHCCKNHPLVISTVRHMTSIEYHENEIESTSKHM